MDTVPNEARTVKPFPANEVTLLHPCYICSGPDVCRYSDTHSACATLDNGLGQVVRASDGRYFVYEHGTFRHVPPAGEVVRLVRRYFLNRTDVLCHFASWGKPCPCEGGDALDAMLLAHVFGPMVPPVVAKWQTRRGDTRSRGHFRLGTYAPAPDGSTKWLCIDLDGAGEHSAPLADPLAVALSITRQAWRVGLAPYLERSKGGSGWHVWQFFDEPLAAKLARALGFALAPHDALLTDGGFADADAGKGIEIFPKADRIKADGVGNQVWLPWCYQAKRGGNVFYRFGGRNLQPFIPEDFDAADAAKAEKAVSRLEEFYAGKEAHLA
jgi:hypothetical protein